MLRKTLLAASALFAFQVGAAHATVVLDPVGDLLVGTQQDLDVLTFAANYNPSTSTFTLTGKMVGDIDTSTGGIYVIGANTGAGALAPFGPLGAPNVKFDKVMILRKDGTGTVSGNALSPTFSGHSFWVSVPLAFLPSTGATPDHYTFNLWPRTATNQITDFAPDNAMLSDVPEPATWAMAITGFALLGAAIRRRAAAAFTRPA